MPDTKNHIGRLITKRRLDLGLTTKQIAAGIGCSAGGFITMLEKGDRQISLEHVVALADVLRVKRKDLIKLALYTKPLLPVYRELFGDQPPAGVDEASRPRPKSYRDEFWEVFEALPQPSRNSILVLIEQMAGVKIGIGQ